MTEAQFHAISQRLIGMQTEIHAGMAALGSWIAGAVVVLLGLTFLLAVLIARSR